MNVIILHCHFERGGVTQVVENHVRSLQACPSVDRIVLVSGSRTSGLSDATLRLVECLQVEDFDYDDVDVPGHSSADRGRQLAGRLKDKLAEAGLDRDDCVLHWHNHSLGKNTAAPAVIVAMAETGWRLLLQIHDFAEDNRPQNYLQLIKATGARDSHQLDAYLYPDAPQIHYAGLTRADASVIASLGVPAEQTHCLPNSVSAPSAESSDRQSVLAKLRQVMGLPADARWTLYPVRGIRRKNVGEFLLLSRWLGDDTFAGLTLCPKTPVERRSYERWKSLAGDLAPRAVFDAAHYEGLSYAESLAACEFVVSTSVAEGFGMAYLEPWLAGRRVIARRLPTVTDDFQSAGVNLSQLYEHIPVPGDTDWLNDCRREIQAAFDQAWCTVPENFRPAFDDEGLHTDGHLDFARLTPSRQIDVLRRAARDEDFERVMQRSSGRLLNSLRDDATNNQGLIDHNAAVVAKEYAVEHQADILLAIYHRLLSTKPSCQVGSPARRESAVDLVSRVRPFFPCRTEILEGDRQ